MRSGWVRSAVLAAVACGACSTGGSHAVSAPSAGLSSPTATPVVASSTTTPVVASSTTTPVVASSPAPATTTASSAPSPVPGTPCARGPAPAHYDHVVWIWMENHTASAVLGAGAPTPYEQSLAAQCGSTTTYRAVGSPSLPNYLAATSGSTQGVHDDGAPSSHPVAADNLFRQVRDTQGRSRSYEEAMASNCQSSASGRYAVKHNPQAYYVGGSDAAACQRDDVPLGSPTAGALADDLASGTLPTFSFVTPDLCNDTHDCDVDVGDAWLQQWVPMIVNSPSYQEGRTAVFVVWDEPTPMPLLVVSPGTPSGAKAAEPFDHYSLLRTTEDLLGLPPLGQATGATSMRDAFGL